MFEFRDTSDMTMGIVEVDVAGVAQALMPEHAFGILMEGMNRKFCWM